MATWQQFSEQAPELAAAVRERFDAHGHKTMATLRADGWPRISGTEITVKDGEMWIAGMPDSRKLVDLRRDPRVAVHSGSDDPAVWKADAKVAGRAVEVDDPGVRRAFASTPGLDESGEFWLFRLELTEAVHVHLGEPADHLLIDSWHEGRGLRQARR